MSTDSLSPLEPRCCRLRCTCQSLWGYERSDSCGTYICPFPAADPHLLSFLFCMFIFFWVLAKELLHSCFFSLDFFSEGPTICPVWRVLFLSGQKTQRSWGFPGFPLGRHSERPSPGCLATCCCGCFQAAGPSAGVSVTFIISRICRLMLGGNEEPPQFLVGFYRRLYGTSQVTLYCYIGILRSHYMDPHQPTIQLTLFPCEGIVLPPGCEASLMASAFSDKAIRQLPNQVWWILWEGRC